MANVLIGLDLGTTLCKSAVYDLQGIQLFSAAQPMFTNHTELNAAEHGLQIGSMALFKF